MRIRKIKDAREKLQMYPEYIVEDGSYHAGSWHKLFANENPIHLEVGMGKGKYIKETAQRNPNINFVGCEVSESTMLRAVRLFPKCRLTNLKLITCHALDLDKVFGFGEIDKVILNFSDPWPKNKHKKRRLTSPDFLKIYKYILTINGEIEFKTDCRNFFEYSLLTFNNFGFTFMDINLDLHNLKTEDIITTEYEERFLTEGKIIYYIRLKK